ncbi:MAG: hypothetical protein E6H02_10585 [Bacillati bacterium ANGP1]|uniref:Uncharacterized protein n=1 Tax=Candidatus Segetimicrobium genomatis TaxID=2569760 RepID=A0A537LJ15_9BACT|nr:MAG: hypothetical protein E6H02_10585 [Terrabacteria group bacterium ANGP1]
MPFHSGFSDTCRADGGGLLTGAHELPARDVVGARAVGRLMRPPSPADLAIGASLLLVAAYLWGSAVNRRVRTRAVRWAGEGLRGLQEGGTVRLLGTSGVLIRQPRPRPELAALQITVLLEPREVGPLWLWHHLQGRRDLAVLAVTLPEPARADLEIVARASAFGRAAIRGLAEADGWRIVDRDATYTIAARRTKDAVALGRGLVRLLSPAIPSLAQVSVRRGAPAVQVGFSLAQPAAPLGPILDALAGAARHPALSGTPGRPSPQGTA